MSTGDMQDCSWHAVVESRSPNGRSIFSERVPRVGFGSTPKECDKVKPGGIQTQVRGNRPLTGGGFFECSAGVV